MNKRSILPRTHPRKPEQLQQTVVEANICRQFQFYDPSEEEVSSILHEDRVQVMEEKRQHNRTLSEILQIAEVWALWQKYVHSCVQYFSSSRMEIMVYARPTWVNVCDRNLSVADWQGKNRFLIPGSDLAKSVHWGTIVFGQRSFRTDVLYEYVQTFPQTNKLTEPRITWGRRNTEENSVWGWWNALQLRRHLRCRGWRYSSSRSPTRTRTCRIPPAPAPASDPRPTCTDRSCTSWWSGSQPLLQTRSSQCVNSKV